jgi:hypothetical protein
LPASHSGRRRAPPGSITRPCQELADDRKVYSKRGPPVSLGALSGRGTLTAKAGPVPENAASGAPRGARRVRRRIRSHRFCAFRRAIPLISGAKSSNPGRIPRRGNEESCLQMSSPPHPSRHATCAELHSRKIAAESPLPTGREDLSGATISNPLPSGEMSARTPPVANAPGEGVAKGNWIKLAGLEPIGASAVGPYRRESPRKEA